MRSKRLCASVSQLWEALLDRFDQYVRQLKEKESDSLANTSPSIRNLISPLNGSSTLPRDMLFSGFRPAVFDDIPITAIMTTEPAGTGTRYVLSALHRNEADPASNKASGSYQDTEIAVDQFWNT
jgi:hypothetical protein